MGTFTDDDENKLEYTQIFEAYVSILEQIISVKLKQTYPEEKVDAFYEDFAANIPKYEALDAITVNVLF